MNQKDSAIVWIQGWEQIAPDSEIIDLRNDVGGSAIF